MTRCKDCDGIIDPQDEVVTISGDSYHAECAELQTETLRMLVQKDLDDKDTLYKCTSGIRKGRVVSNPGNCKSAYGRFKTKRLTKFDETLEDFDNSIERALAGFMFGKSDDEVTDEEYQRAVAVVKSFEDFNDYIELSNALDTENDALVHEILAKNGVNDYPQALGKPEFEMAENISILDSDYIIREGFNYVARIEEDKTRQTFLDWLVDNDIKFVLGENGALHVSCQDRQTAYRVGSGLSSILRKASLVRDSLEEAKKKKKEPKSGPRLPKGVIEKLKQHQVEKPAKGKGSYDRKTSKKEVEMSKKDINEGVIGMVNVPQLNRLKQLAGIKEDEFSSLDQADDTISADLGVDADAAIDSAMGSDVAAPTTGDPAIDTPVSAPVDAVPATTAMDTMAGGNAYGDIRSNLDSIRASVTNLTLSEYKTFVQDLQQFIQDVKIMGRSYLGESKKG